ncbi:MAG: zinc-finger domain-containing protein [Alphaproteobacteria bacterium]|nr:zinc-finger domain-containing protein [Alphaproteobacteria bacterium]
MALFETVEIDEMVTECSGSGGALGHPRVYLNLAPAGRAECPYCSRVFINRAVAAPHAGEHGYSGVATPGAQGADAAPNADRPPPRQSPV